MATTIDELVVRIKADTKQLNKALDDVKKKTKDVGQSGKKGLSPSTNALLNMRLAASAAGTAILGMKGAMMAVGTVTGVVLIAMTKKIADVGMAFEDLQISLNTVFGGIEGGSKAFDQVIDFAKTTPFQIEDVTKAFIRLKSAGLEPNLEMLKTFGDAASIAGNATEAFASLVKIASKATGGGLGLEELEQLETQGIAVYPILRKQLGLTRDKIADFGKSTAGAALIIKALQKGLKETTGGTMAARMENLSTKVSNLQIAFKQLALTIFSGGLGDDLKDMADQLTRFVDAIARAIGIRNKLKRGEKLSASENVTEINSMLGKNVVNNSRMKSKLSSNVEQAIAIIPMLDLDALKEAQQRLRLGMLESVKAYEKSREQGRANETDNIREVILGQKSVNNELQHRINILKEAQGIDEASVLGNQQGDELASKETIDNLALVGKAMGFSADLDKLREKTKDALDPFREVDEMMTQIGLASLIMKDKLNDAGEKIGVEREFSDDDLTDMTALVGKLKAEIQLTIADDSIQDIQDQYGEIAGAIQGTITPAQALEKQIEAIALALGTDQDAFMKMFPEMTVKQVEDGLVLLRAELKGMQDDAENTELSDQYADLKSAVEGTVTPFETLKATIANLQTAINDKDGVLLNFLFGARTPEEIEAVMVTLRDNLKDIKDAAEDTSKTLGTQLQQAVTNAANAFTTNFVNALMDGKNALGAFKDFAKSMVSQIIAIFLQMAIVNEILNSVFNLQGANRFSTISNPNPTADNASGGHYSKGKPMLVGERGPELIIPNTSGSVMNGMNTKSAMGGGSTIVVNQSLNFSTGVVGTVRAEINKMMPTIAEVSKSAVLDASRRGGNYRKGLLGA